MRRLGTLASLAIVTALALTGCSDGSTAKSKSSHTTSASATPTRTASARHLVIAPVNRTSTFEVGDRHVKNHMAYTVTFKRGALTGYKHDLAATGTSGIVRDMPLNAGCKSMKPSMVAYPFTIAVTGTTKANGTGAIVKITALTKVDGTPAPVPTGAVKMEFMQSSGTPRCFNLDEGVNPESYMTFGSTLYKRTQTMAGWIILDASKADHYSLAVTSHPAYMYPRPVTGHTGEFTTYSERVLPSKKFMINGGTMPLVPGALNKK